MSIEAIQAQCDHLVARNALLCSENAKLREQRDTILAQVVRDQNLLKACIAECHARDAFEEDETPLTQAAFNEAVTRRRHAIGEWEAAK